MSEEKTPAPAEDIIEINTDDYKRPVQPAFIPSPGLFHPPVEEPFPASRPATADDLFTPPPVEAPKIEPLNVEEIIAKSRLPNGGIDFAAIKEAQDKYWANFASSMEQMKISNMSRFPPTQNPTTTGIPQRGVSRGPSRMNHRGATPGPSAMGGFPPMGAPAMGGFPPMGAPGPRMGTPMSFTSEDLPHMRLQERISALEAQRKPQL